MLRLAGLSKQEGEAGYVQMLRSLVQGPQVMPQGIPPQGQQFLETNQFAPADVVVSFPWPSAGGADEAGSHGQRWPRAARVNGEVFVGWEQQTDTGSVVVVQRVDLAQQDSPPVQCQIVRTVVATHADTIANYRSRFGRLGVGA